MEIDYRGANCVVIKLKDATIVTDPTSNVSVKKELDDPSTVVLATQPSFAPAEDSVKSFIIDMPGEYEHKDISVRGIPVKAHLASDENAQDATMYSIHVNGLRIAVIGHTVAPIEDDDLEDLGLIDIAIIPVGGNGYTLDARDAAAIVRKINPAPKIVIPTHYDDGVTKYEVTQDGLAVFEKEWGGNVEKQTALKLKDISKLSPDKTTVVELTVSK